MKKLIKKQEEKLKMFSQDDIPSKKELVLYGAGHAAYIFLYEHPEFITRIHICIDAYVKGKFLGIPVITFEEVSNLENKFFIIAAFSESFIQISRNLKMKGLKEFENFIWANAYDKLLIICNGNCHGVGLIKYLEMSNKFREKYCVYPISQIHLNVDKRIDENVLAHCDLYLHQDIRTDNSISYYLSDEYILPLLREDTKSICFPNLVGMGHFLFPQQGTLLNWETSHGLMYVMYKDNVLEEGYNNGLTKIDEYIDFWVNYVN